ncbi:MAG TPA: ATP-binding protein [Armatimonadota bacterium]|jgi:PAS domain S-box-containing protein
MSLAYAFVAALWILLSDRFVSHVATSPRVFTLLSTYKGWAFVAVTASLLYLERRFSERKLEESEQRFRAAFMDAGYCVLLLDEQGRVTTSNHAAQRVFGYGAVEFAEVGLRELVPKERWTDESEALSQLASGARDALPPRERQYLRRDGTPFLARHAATALRSAEQSARLSIHLIEDITEQRALEDQLLHSQKMEAIGMLAGGVAHDFNNLLTAIQGYTQLALTQAGGQEGITKHLKEVLRAAERAGSLTRQLLTFSRKQAACPKLLDLNEVVGDMERLLRRLIGDHVELTTTLNSGLGKVRMDQGQLEQIVLNLAVNARDAMPDGGTIRIETAQVELSPGNPALQSEAAPGHYVLLAVVDSGHGMDETTQAQIFQPFFTTKEKGQGTGLGLATVYGAARQAGGWVLVTSRPGDGATFRVYLPVSAERNQGETETQVAPVPSSGGHETVLVVDDDPAVRQVVKAVLSSRGYRVLEADRGEAALEVCRSEEGPIDLLLTDLVMPGIPGQELARRVAGLRPEARTLLMTGYLESALAGRPADGEADLLRKPFTPDELAERVRTALDRPRTRA